MRFRWQLLGACAFICGFLLYSYLETQADLAKMRLQIPELSARVQTLREEKVRLTYVQMVLESPERLLTLAKNFSHLHFPAAHEIIHLPISQPLIAQAALKQVSSRPLVLASRTSL